MSQSLSDVAREEFDSLVHQQFQGVAELDGTVTKRTGVVGDTYDFRRIARGIANQKASADDVTPMDVAHTVQIATLQNWLAPEYTDIFDQAEVNFDEKMELAQTIAMALGRRDDQLTIDALDAATPTTTTVGTAVGGDTAMNKGKILRAASELNEKGVPRTDRNRYIATSAQGLEGILDETPATSSDFVQVQALITGDLEFWMGFIWRIIDDRSAAGEEGGLSISGSTRDSWAWHKAAMGKAEGIARTTEVNYVPVKTSWLSNGFLKSGAVNRDPRGIVKIQHVEA